MFYSHEVLTSRKYGVATVWLVATLGSKSNLRKINRKAILDVDIPKACRTITEPEAPMALRLQSNLLYGVSRVYSQKCIYVLVDAQAAQNNMKTLLKVVKPSELDPDAGKARPDQLVLQDDPAFLPDFDLLDLDLDLSLFEASTQGSSQRSSIMSGHSHQSSRSSNVNEEPAVAGLVIPSSSSGNAGGIGGFALPESEGSRGANIINEDEGFFPDVDFNFDAEGNLIELGEGKPTPGGEPDTIRARIRSDSETSAIVRREHQEGLIAGRLDPVGGTNPDAGLPSLGDDYDILPHAEPFPEMVAERQSFLKSSSEVPEEESSEFAETAQVRRRHGRKLLPTDVVPELRNSDLAQWNTDYLANMAVALRRRQHHKLPAQARKNAAEWVFGIGIGGAGTDSILYNVQGPLDMFAGDKLVEALTGIKVTAVGRKRGRGEEDEQSSGSEERRVRLRSEDGEQTGRGEGLDLGEDDMLPLFDDTAIELGRDALPLLEDHSLQMPWNISASIHGSRQGSRQGSLARARGLTSSVGGFPTSAGGPSSLPPLPTSLQGSLDRRASRLTSASPLIGRGTHPPGSFDLSSHHDEDDLLGDRLMSDDPALEDFQLYGPAAAVDTQTAAQSQWVKAALDRESTNFFNFVKAELATTEEDEDDDDELGGTVAQIKRVSFHQLLPPSQHSKIVAAQAFHHVLALATKGLLKVEQEVGYGPIELAIAAGS